MSERSLRKVLRGSSRVKVDTIEEHLTESYFEDLMDQLQGVTMMSDEDGDTVVPSRDVRRALNNPGEVV